MYADVVTASNSPRPYRWSASLTILLLAITLAAHGQLLENVTFSDDRAGGEAAVVERVRFKVPRTAGAPTVDGELTEACWRQPGAYLGKFRLGLSTTPARHYREAWAVYDSDTLYFGIKLQREPGTELRAFVHSPDDPAIWEDDEFELFLDPFRTGTEYFQLIMNSEGVIYDALHRYRVVPDPAGASPTDTKLARETDADWSSDAIRAVAIHEEFWSAELAVPLRSVGLSGAPQGHVVHMNLTSADWDTGEYTTLCPNSSWHDPAQFGAIVLGAPRVQVTRLRLDKPGIGRNLVLVKARDLTGEGGDYELVVRIAADIREFTIRRNCSIAPGGRTAVGAVFKMVPGDGAWEADITLVDENGQPVFAARRSGVLPEPLTLRTRSRAVFTDGAPVFAAARVRLGRLTARRTELVAELLDGRGRSIASQNLGVPQGSNMKALLPVSDLRPGSYTLRLTAASRDQTLGEATVRVSVAGSPFSAGASH